MADRVNNLSIENAKITFRNFSGNEGKYNDAGERNFCVFIDDPKQAQALLDDGWRIRVLMPRNPDDDPRHYMQVKVSFDNYPPNIYMITRKHKVRLTEETVGSLDYADIASIDMVLRPYAWTNARGESGIKAYVKTMYVTINEDEFAAKYDMDECPEDDNPF